MIFALCEELYQSGYIEEAFIVSEWMSRYIRNLDAGDILTFRRWIDSYVTNWAECDDFANHTVGGLIEKYPRNSV